MERGIILHNIQNIDGLGHTLQNKDQIIIRDMWFQVKMTGGYMLRNSLFWIAGTTMHDLFQIMTILVFKMFQMW